MYIIYFDHIHFPLSCLAPPSYPSTSLSKLHVFYSPLSSNSAPYMCVAMRPCTGVWATHQGHTLKVNKLYFPPQELQLSIAPAWGWLVNLSPNYSRTLTGLNLCRSCAGCHSCYEFMSIIFLLYPEDTVDLGLFRPSHSLFPPTVKERGCGKNSRAGVAQKSHLELSTLLSHCLHRDHSRGSV